jgi:hypothetical protein
VEPVAEAAAEAPKRSRRGRRGKAEAAETVEAVVAEVVEAVVVATAEAPERASRRSRNRRRRGAQDAVETTAEAPVEAVAVQEPAAEEPARPRSRRRKGKLVEAEVASAQPAAEAAETEEEQTAEEEGAGRRSRRRRGGRRRRGDDVSIEDIETPELLTTDEEAEEEEIEEDDSLLPLIRPAMPVYVAPPLVPEVPPLADDRRKPRVTASVAPYPGHGMRRVVIDHRNHAPYFFFVNAEAAADTDTVDAQIRQAASMGVHLYSTVMHLPLKNAYGDRSFGTIDSIVQQVLDADPDGYLLPRLQLVPTNFWIRTHPGETALFAGGIDGDVSLASIDFWMDCVDAIDALIEHFADPHTPGGDRIIGFHLDRGEWFHDAMTGPDLSAPNRTAFRNWLQAKYQALYALRAAWYDASVTFETADIPAWHGKSVHLKRGDTPLYATAREGRWVDYSLFASECTANVIAGLARAVKSLSNDRYIVAVSYGYTLEFSARNDSGHLAMGTLLESPDIDIVAGPNAYTGRTAGNAASFGALVDSVHLHGKLWIVEDDTKTFLAEAETDDSYNPKIISASDTRAAHQRHFGAALAHGAGVDWMDLWGQGWLNAEDVWQELGGLQDLADRWSRSAPEAGVRFDVAVLVDEASLAFVKNDAAGLNAHLIGKTRDLLLRTGASVGFYLQSDITREDFPDARVYLFLNALRLTTAERQAVRERLQRRGKTLVWLYAPGLFDEKGPSTQESGDVVGMALRRQPWNSRLGSQLLESRHPIAERVRHNRRIGQDEVLNPSFSVTDPQAVILGEYTATGAPSFAVREHADGWRSVFLGEPYLTVELLRSIFSYANVSLYDVQDDVVYAGGDGVLLIHAPFTGQRTIRLPQRATVYDAFENRIVATETNTFRSFLRARTTRLLFWGPSERISELSGIEITPGAHYESARDHELHEPHHDDLPSHEPQDDGPHAGLVAEPPRQSFVSEPPRHHVFDDGPRTEPAFDDLAQPRDEITGIDEPELAIAAPPASPRRARDADEFLANLPGMEPVEPLAVTEEALAAAETSLDGAQDEETPATPRSRWQRRRAAAKARREAERRTAHPDGPPDRGNAAAPPIDIAAILPDLPPRRRTGRSTPNDGTGA